MSINGQIPDLACNSLSIKGKTIIDKDRNIKAKDITVKNINVRGHISKKWIQLPNNDIASFIPRDGALYLTKNYTANHSLTLIDADIENELQLNVGEYISFYVDASQSTNLSYYDVNIITDNPLQVASTDYWTTPINDYCYQIALIKQSDTFPRHVVTLIGNN